MFDLLTYDSDGRPRLTVTVENKTPTLSVFTAQNGIPPTTDYATRDVRGLFPVLDFDNTTSESIYFVGLMPQQYQNNGMTAYVYFTSDATSGDVDWDISFDRLTSADLDIDGNSFGDVTSSNNNTVSGTSGVIMIAELKSISAGVKMDNVVAGDMFMVKLTRDIADTSAGDANFLALELRGV
tara:strand:- start:2658 stop:3203 length:546 start_codon:yes stop_codon:yes gene_type:complete